MSQRKITDFVLGFVSPERLEGPRWWLGMSVRLWGAARSSRKWVQHPLDFLCDKANGLIFSAKKKNLFRETKVEESI